MYKGFLNQTAKITFKNIENNLNRHFSKDMHMANRHMKRYSSH